MASSLNGTTPSRQQSTPTPGKSQEQFASQKYFHQKNTYSPQPQQHFHSNQQNSSYPNDVFSDKKSSRKLNQLRAKSTSPTRQYYDTQKSPKTTSSTSRSNSRSPRRNLSRSPNPKQDPRTRQESKSRSPIPSRQRGNHPHITPYNSVNELLECMNYPRSASSCSGPADMTVLVTRTDLFDSGTYFEREMVSDDRNTTSPGPSFGGISKNQIIDKQKQHYLIPELGDYSWRKPVSSDQANQGTVDVYVCQPQSNFGKTSDIVVNEDISNTGRSGFRHSWMHPSALLVDKNTPNPLSMNPELTKYWNQRRRLFSRFDSGIELDDEGWYSVTPEQIADHVASRMVELVQHNRYDQMQRDASFPYNLTKNDENIVVLDAFCGCGGNGISFAKLSHVRKVICVDIDRTKLRKAANNASIYEIPATKIVFVECNVLFILQYCYRDGKFILDEPVSTPEAAMKLMEAMPPPVETETYKGFQVGGIELLPHNIDVVFLDPPWGGVDYAVFGKNGYDLQRNMRIQRPSNRSCNVSAFTQPFESSPGSNINEFFDTFQTTPRNKQERRAQFNSGLDESNCANGAELLAAAAMATSPDRHVIYDVPRNTNRVSLGQSALLAGYHGTIKVEEHYLNGRLKTITAYFGRDWKDHVLMPLSLAKVQNNKRSDNEKTMAEEEFETELLQPIVETSTEKITDDIVPEQSNYDVKGREELEGPALPFLPA